MGKLCVPIILKGIVFMHYCGKGLCLLDMSGRLAVVCFAYHERRPGKYSSQDKFDYRASSDNNLHTIGRAKTSCIAGL